MNELQDAESVSVSIQFRSDYDLETCYIDAFNNEISAESIDRFIQIYNNINGITLVDLNHTIYMIYNGIVGAYNSCKIALFEREDGVLIHECWIEVNSRFYFLLNDVDIDMTVATYNYYVGNKLALKKSMDFETATKVLSQVVMDHSFEKKSKKLAQIL